MKHGAAVGWPHGAEPEYRVWLHLRGRCNTPTDAAYPHYGGRGSRVCNRWGTYSNFLADMGRRPTPKHTLERVDNDAHYEPDNCRWVTMKEQCRNRRSSRVVTYRGQAMSLAEACERAGLNYKTVTTRIYRGQSPEQALQIIVG
jgi:hypothetical protein